MAAGGYPDDWLYHPILAAWPSAQEFQCGYMRKHVDVPQKDENEVPCLPF